MGGKGGESSTDQLNGSSSWAARTLKPAEKLEAREDFIWDTTDEPHASRRKEIMKAHPEVKKLFGHEWKSKYLCMFLLIIPQIWDYIMRQEVGPYNRMKRAVPVGDFFQ